MAEPSVPLTAEAIHILVKDWPREARPARCGLLDGTDEVYWANDKPCGHDRIDPVHAALAAKGVEGGN